MEQRFKKSLKHKESNVFFHKGSWTNLVWLSKHGVPDVFVLNDFENQMFHEPPVETIWIPEFQRMSTFSKNDS